MRSKWNKRKNKYVITIISISSIVLSPLWSVPGVMATAIPLSLGGTINFTGSSPTGLTSTDQYEYSLSLADANSNPISDIGASGATIAFGGTSSSMTTSGGTSVVYTASGLSMSTSAPTINLNALDVGTYSAQLQLTDTTTNTVVSTTSQNVTVNAPTSPNLSLTSTMTSPPVTGQMDNLNLSTSSISTQDPVYYHLQVQENGGIPGSADVTANINGNPLNLTDGIGVSASSSLPTSGASVPIGLVFNLATTYQVYVTVVDATTNVVLGTAVQTVQVVAPNVTVSMPMPQNASDPVIGVNIQSTDPSNPTTYFASEDPNNSGNFNCNLPASNYPYQVNSVVVQTSANSNVTVMLNQPMTVNVNSTNVSTLQTISVPTLTGYGTFNPTPDLTNFTNMGTFSNTNGSQYVLYPVNGSVVDYNTPISLNVSSNNPIYLEAGSYDVANFGVNYTPPKVTGNSINGYLSGGPITMAAGSSITSITPANVGLDLVAGSMPAISGKTYNPNIHLGDSLLSTSSTPNPLSFTLSVNDLAGNPISTAGPFTFEESGTNNVTQSFTYNANNNDYELAQSVSVLSGDNVQLGMDFPSTGTYVITLSATDSAGAVVGTSSQVVTVVSPNVTGTVVAADGTTPVPMDNVNISGPNSFSSMDYSDQSGKMYESYAASGTYTFTLADNGGSQTVNVSSSGTASPFTLVDSTYNVVGTATLDGKPVANGAVMLTPSGSNQSIYVPTNSQGQFAASMTAGATYTPTSLSVNGATAPIPLSGQPSFTVNNLGATTVSIVSNDIPVSGTLTQNPAIQVVGINAQSGDHMGYYSASVGSNGGFTFYLPASSLPYVINSVMVQSGSNSTPPVMVMLSQPVTFTVSSSSTPATISIPELTGYEAFTPSLDFSSISNMNVQSSNNGYQYTLYPIGGNGQPNYSQPLSVFVGGSGSTMPPVYLESGNYQVGSVNVPYSPSFAGAGSTFFGDLGMGPISVGTSAFTGTLTPDAVSLDSLSGFAPALVGNSIYSFVHLQDALLPTSSTSTLHFTLSLTDTSGNPVASAGIFGFSEFGIDNSNQSFVYNTTNHDFELSKAITVQKGDALQISSTFSSAGKYLLTLTATDASGNVLGTSTQFVNVITPNVTAAVVAADGTTPIAYDAAGITGPNNYQGFANSDPNGTMRIYANMPGSYKVTLNDGGGTGGFTVASDGTVTGPSPITDTTYNVVGTAYLDASHTTPLANGMVGLLPPGGSSTDPSTWIWIPTNQYAQFATNQLTSGSSYTPMMINAMGQPPVNLVGQTPFTVNSSGVTTVTVAPLSSNVKLPVKDQNGNSVTSGFVAVFPAGNFPPTTSADFNSVIFLPIDSSGNASGYLTPGNYVVGAIQNASMFTTVDVPITVPNTGSLTTGTIEPAQVMVNGTLTDASGSSIANATVFVKDTSTSQVVGLMTDKNGTFTNLGYDKNGLLVSLLASGHTYQLMGVNVAGTFTPMTGTFSASQGASWNITVPGVDLTGTVTLDGQVMTSGAMILAPQSTPNDPSTYLNEPIQNGTYSATLQSGQYVVVGVISATGQYRDVSGASQTPSPIAVTNMATTTTVNIVIANNFIGQLVNGSNPIANATMFLSQVQNPTTSSQWANVLAINTDGNGNFNSSLPTGTWYLIGYADQNNNFFPASLSVSIPGANPSLTLNVAPNVTVSVNWGTAPSSVSQAWLVLQDPSSGQFVSTQLSGSSSLSSGTWSFSTQLPTTSTFKVLGISTVDASGNNTWYDLTAQNQTITPTSSQQTITINLNTRYPGTVSGSISSSSIKGPGSIIFQDNSGKQVQVYFDSSGNFSTTLDGSWTPKAVQTANGTSFNVSGSSFTNNVWSITVQ